MVKQQAPSLRLLELEAPTSRSSGRAAAAAASNKCARLITRLKLQISARVRALTHTQLELICIIITTAHLLVCVCAKSGDYLFAHQVGLRQQQQQSEFLSLTLSILDWLVCCDDLNVGARSEHTAARTLLVGSLVR